LEGGLIRDTSSAARAARLRVSVFSLFSAIYFMSFLQRVSISVVATEFQAELGLNSVQLGMMTSGFFIAYAAVQPIIGLLSDKAGPEPVAAGSLVVAAIGSFVFVAARSFGVAFMGRVLIGLGFAAGFIPGVKAIAEMFPPNSFSSVNAVFLALGQLGSLVGAAPLAWATAAAGWRAVFTGLAVASVVLAVLCIAYAGWRARSAAADRRREAGAAAVAGATVGAVEGAGAKGERRATNREVLLSARVWLLAFYLFTKYGSQVTFQGLWGVPYLMAVYGVNATQAASAITMLAVGYVVAAPLVGRLADWLVARGMDQFAARRRLLIGTTVMAVVAWVPMVVAPGWAPWSVLQALLFIMGIGYSSASLIFGIGKDLFPSSVSGFVTALINVTSIAGGAAMPPLVGWLVQRGLDGGAAAERVYAGILWPGLIACAASLVLVMAVTRPRERGQGQGQAQGAGQEL
jgi:sugar phosphate permease